MNPGQGFVSISKRLTMYETFHFLMLRDPPLLLYIVIPIYNEQDANPVSRRKAWLADVCWTWGPDWQNPPHYFALQGAPRISHRGSPCA
jgi:hypothetical protein